MTKRKQEREVNTTDGTTATISSVIDTSLIPDHVREDIGRVGLKAVIEYYKDPENERRFQEWVVEYRKRRAERARKGGLA